MKTLAVSTLVFSRITPLFYKLSNSFLARFSIFTSYCKLSFSVDLMSSSGAAGTGDQM